MQGSRGALVVFSILVLASPSMAEPVRIRSRVLGPAAQAASARAELFSAVETYADAVRRLEGEEPPPLASTRPGPDGTFELEAPESGLYRVVVRADGYLALEQPAVAVADFAELSPVELEPASSSLEVRATGPRGRPLPDLLVVAESNPNERDIARPSGWRRVPRRGRTGPDGKLALARSPNESMSVYAASAGTFWPVQTAVETRSVEVRQPAFLHLVVVQGAEGRPVARALLRRGSQPVGLSGPDGRLRVGLEEIYGDRFLTIETPDGRWAALPSTPPPGQAPGRPWPLRTAPPQLVQGRVTEAGSGRPVAGALIWSEPRLSAPVRTDASGRFRLPVPSGPSAQLGVFAAGYLSPDDLPVRGVDMAVALRPEAAVEGRIEDAQGRPVPWARVEVQENARPRYFREGERAWSRPDGRFRLRGLLPRAVYQLSVSADGFARASVTARTAPPGRAPAPVRIVLDTGRSARGRLVDESGQPVGGAAVSLAVPGPLGLEEAESRALSDAEGRFEVRRLSPGLYDLKVERRGFAPLRRPGVEIAGTSADLGVVTLLRGAALEGTVRDRQGAPVAGAEIAALLVRGRSSFMQPVRHEPPLRARTGADGRFVFSDLRPGMRYDLRIVHPGHPPAEAMGVQAPTLVPLDIELATARSASGRVLGPGGEPVVDASVLLVQDDRARGGSSQSTREGGRTGPDGEFRIPNLPPGSLDLEVAARGYKNRRLFGLRVPDDRDLDGLEIALEGGSMLDGRVRDSAGEPLPKVSIWTRLVRPLEEIGATRRDSWQSERAFTDGDGRFSLNLEPGVFAVTAMSAVSRPAEVKVTVQPGANEVEIVLEKAVGVEVSGQVLDEESGDPISGAEVILRKDNVPSFGSSTEADGSFLLSYVKDGTYNLTVRRQGFAEADPSPMQVAGAPVSGIEVRLKRQPEATLRGRISGLDPEELAQVQIGASKRFDFDRQGRASWDGSYTVEGLTPGEWNVTATTPSVRTAAGTVRIEPEDREVHLDLSFEKGVTLSGRVLVGGEPLRGAKLTAYVPGKGGSFGGEARTGYEGAFSIPALAPGTYQLTILHEGRGIVHGQQVELTSDREIDIEIATGAIAGRVLAASGEPVSGVEILAHGLVYDLTAWTSALAARTGDAGDFEMPGVAAGTYELSIQADGFRTRQEKVTVTPGGTVQVQVVLEPGP